MWSRKFEKCIKCGTTLKIGKHKHKGRGLCRSCWDKKRMQREDQKELRRKAAIKFYNKNKDRPEFIEYLKNAQEKWQKTERYQVYLKKKHIKASIDRFIDNENNHIGRNLKKNIDCIEYRCYSCEKECLVKTNIKKKIENIDINMYLLDIFREQKIKYCIKNKICRTTQ